MTVAFPISLFVMGGIVLLALFAFELIAGVCNRIVGHRRTGNEPSSARRSRILPRGMLVAAVVAVLLVTVFRLRSRPLEAVRDDAVHDLAADVQADVHESLREAMQGISDARREIQAAVQDGTKVIPVDAAAIDSREPQPAIEPSPLADKPVSPAIAEPAVATVAAARGEDPPTAQAASETDTATVTLPTDSEEMQQRKQELAAHIGQWMRSLLEKSSPGGDSTADDTQAAQSANGDVVVVQLSDQVAEQLLGESGHKLLKSFNAELPERIRQTYALIPLTPPVDAAMSPMRPLLANGGLETIANSLVAILERAESAEPVVKSASTDAAVVLAQQPEIQSTPAWVRAPDGGRIVVETGSLLPGDDAQQPLIGAINEALIEHLSVFTETLDPVLHHQTQFVRLKLDRETAEQCIIQKFERREMLQTGVEGPKAFRKVYALVEFPESVDKVAVQKIRQSVQKDRMTGLGIIVMSAWLSVCSAGCSIRLWRNGARWLRMTVIPLAGATGILLLACSTGLIIAFARGETPRPPWEQNEPPVMIHVDSAV